MAWHFYDDSNQRTGPVTSEELKILAVQGVITRKTRVEAQNGSVGLAGNIRNSNGNELLFYRSPFQDIFEAITLGAVKDVKCFIENQDVNVNVRGERGWTPMFSAAARGQVEVMELLAKTWKADVNAKDDNGFRPIHTAAIHDQTKSLKCLVKELGVDVNKKNKGRDDGSTALHIAVWRGHIPSINCLAKELGADVNAENNAKVTPLFMAAMESRIEGMDCLFDLCKELNLELKLVLESRSGITLWDSADLYNQPRLKDWLRDKEEKGEITKPVPRPKPSEITNIFEAAETGTVGNVRYFVEQKGVNVNLPNDKGNMPLHFAVDNPDIEVMKYLVSKGADVNATNKDGNTPLYFAARDNSNVDFLEYLISQHADVNAICFKGNTPLHIAAQCNANVDILRCLISHRADVNSDSQVDGCTPLALAVIRNSNVDVSKCLVSNHANVNVTIHGMTLRDCASHNSNPEVLRYIISVT
jgi:serine/threonine-protein phosphatase 6 regulatory ankyrin repeat subunit B